MCWSQELFEDGIIFIAADSHVEHDQTQLIQIAQRLVSIHFDKPECSNSNYFVVVMSPLQCLHNLHGESFIPYLIISSSNAESRAFSAGA